MTSPSLLPNLFRILSDRTRLRVLGLVAREELGVSELAGILGQSLSRLSNHLRLLREAGLIADRKEGSWTFVRLDREGGLPKELWAAVEAEIQRDPEVAEDSLRLAQVLDERRAKSRAFFDRVAPDWDVMGSDFKSGSGRHRVAAHLLPPGLVVADVGCGTGYLAAALAPLVRRVILVDHSAAMLDRARENLAGSPCTIETRPGELDDLPLEDEEVDGIVAGMVLHHAPDPTAFFREAWRVLKPNGTLVVEDLLPHKEAWMRDSMADLRLGMDPRQWMPRLEAAGFTGVATETLEDTYQPQRPDGTRVDLPLFVMRAQKASAKTERIA